MDDDDDDCFFQMDLLRARAQDDIVDLYNNNNIKATTTSDVCVFCMFHPQHTSLDIQKITITAIEKRKWIKLKPKPKKRRECG